MHQWKSKFSFSSVSNIYKFCRVRVLHGSNFRHSLSHNSKKFDSLLIWPFPEFWMRCITVLRLLPLVPLLPKIFKNRSTDGKLRKKSYPSCSEDSYLMNDGWVTSTWHFMWPPHDKSHHMCLPAEWFKCEAAPCDLIQRWYGCRPVNNKQ